MNSSLMIPVFYEAAICQWAGTCTMTVSYPRRL